MVTLVTFFALYTDCLDIEGLPAVPIVIGNIPQSVPANFQPGGNAIGTVLAVQADGPVAGIVIAQPPVAVFADVGREALLASGLDHRVEIANPPIAVLTDDRGQAILAVVAHGPVARVLAADPPIAILADLRGQAVLTVLAVVSGGLIAGVLVADPPVAVAANIRRFAVFSLFAVLALGGNPGVQVTQPPIAVLTDSRRDTVPGHGRIARILAVDKPVPVLADLRGVADGLDLGIHIPDPPVAIVADIGGVTVFALLAVLAVGARGLDLGIRQTDPPIAVFTDVGGVALLAVFAVLSGGLDPGVGTADPPVAVAADVGGVIRPIIDLVGPDAFVVLPVQGGYGGDDEGVFTRQVNVTDRVLRILRRKLVGYPGVGAVLHFVDIKSCGLQAAGFRFRLGPGQGDGALLNMDDPVQVADRVRRGG